MSIQDWHIFSKTLQWHQNGRDGVSNHQLLNCLLNCLFKRRSKKKHQSSASLAFVRGIHRWPVVSAHKGPVTRKMFPFDDAIMHSMNPLIRFHVCTILRYVIVDNMSKWQPYKQLCLLCLPDPWNLPGTASFSGFQSFRGALKSTGWDSS